MNARDDRPENVEGSELAKVTVVTGNFTDASEVFQVEKALRQLGVKQTMK
jgi:hypothetical protein